MRISIFHAATLFVFMMLWSAVSFPAEGRSPEAYLDRMVRQARELNLAEDRFWHLLLHYRKGLLGGYESEQDGPAFFNADNGKVDPASELVETIRGFFKDPAELNAGEEHPQCNFPARYKWLKLRLDIDPDRLPEQPCERLRNWMEGLNPDKVTLVFASYYLNNPASMFGHTLLRIDKRHEGEPLELLNYGVNYSANVDTANPFLYVFKGMFGMFPGVFSVFPYYIKVQEYSNLESRDVWEYELNFTEDQIDYLLLHLWELGGNYFDYYYFQENCSYHILSLLEVANPDLHLTDQFLFAVIPADTIKVLRQHEGVISDPVYRPSLVSQMNEKVLRMTPPQKAVFRSMIKSPFGINLPEFQNLADQEKAMILDTVLDYAQYQDMRAGKNLNSVDAERMQILLARSRLGRVENDFDSMARFSTPPELGHGSDRIRSAIGVHEGDLFEEIAYRPGYHDVLARDVGYGKDSQILFFDSAVRYYHESRKAKLDHMKLFDIVSLIPYDNLFRKKSWKLSFGIDSMKDLDCGFCNSLKGHYALGLAYKRRHFSPILLYSLVDLEVESSGDLEDYYRAGGGGTLGFLVDLTERWRVQFLANYLYFPLGHESDYDRLAVNQRVWLSQNLDVRAEVSKLDDMIEGLLSFNAYF